MIHQLSPRHAAVIESLEMATFPDHAWNEQTIERRLKDGWGLAYILDGKTLAGYVICKTEGELTDIMRLGVHPSYQRQGIGRKLLEAAKEKGAPHLLICVNADNHHARDMYLASGFIPTGSLKQDASTTLVLEQVRASGA